ncbi:hypothetical protein C5C18_09235 [Rathayibacter tritici]|nr:hypothetical protein C5C18_09235 [Rathayibacter tritici]
MRVIPFTLSHAVVALAVSNGRIPAAAVAVGAMMPDIGMYFPIGVARESSHSLLGVVTVDLLLGRRSRHRSGQPRGVGRRHPSRRPPRLGDSGAAAAARALPRLRVVAVRERRARLLGLRIGAWSGTSAGVRGRWTRTADSPCGSRRRRSCSRPRCCRQGSCSLGRVLTRSTPLPVRRWCGRRSCSWPEAEGRWSRSPRSGG